MPRRRAIQVGDRVRVKPRARTIYAGRAGNLLAVENTNPHYAHLPNTHLVQLDAADGGTTTRIELQLWYRPEQLEIET